MVQAEPMLMQLKFIIDLFWLVIETKRFQVLTCQELANVLDRTDDFAQAKI